jgi:hypothetical protein
MRLLLSLAMLALVTTPNAVQPETASKGADAVGVPSDAALFILTAKPRQLLLRPDGAPTSVVATATLPRGRSAPSTTLAGHQATIVEQALLRWRAHLPRSQAEEPPPSPSRTIVA